MSKSSKKNSASKKYLKVLGVIEIILGLIIIALGIILVAAKVNINDLGINWEEIRKNGEITDDVIRAILCGVICAMGAIQALIGALLIRAAKNPKKSVFVLVLLILSVITAIYNIITTNQFSSISAGISTVVSLTVDVLALIAIFNIRKEIEE